MNVVFEDNAGQDLFYYTVRDQQAELVRKISNPQVATFAALGESLFMASGHGLLSKLSWQGVEEDLQVTDFNGVVEVSSNGRHLLVLLNDGTLILVGESGSVLNRVELGFPVREINLGKDDTVWIAGGDEVLGGYQVFWSENFRDFRPIPWPASAVRLFGDHEGIVWTVNSRSEIWKLHRLGEGNMPGCRQNAGCRNCMFKQYGQAQQVASTSEGFLVLDANSSLKVFASAESKVPLAEWHDVGRFMVS
jgi:hypothetical protein